MQVWGFGKARLGQGLDKARLSLSAAQPHLAQCNLPPSMHLPISTSAFCGNFQAALQRHEQQGAVTYVHQHISHKVSEDCQSMILVMHCMYGICTQSYATPCPQTNSTRARHL